MPFCFFTRFRALEITGEKGEKVCPSGRPIMGGGEGGKLEYTDMRMEGKYVGEIIRQNGMLKRKAAELEAQRDKLRSYKPGNWIVETGGFSRKDFGIPQLTTLLVVGPMGAGKSTLINNLIRVLNQLNSGFDRAQVCGDPSENGTVFLKEYTLCDMSKSICIFDTRGFSEIDPVEDSLMLKNWMKHGVRHGQIVLRSSDSSNMHDSMEMRGRHGHHKLSVRRAVNFVIFVVSAVAIHNMKETGAGADLTRLYKSPFLAFKDDRPVVVMTHGDELSSENRMAARIYLGEILGVSPVNQIFDIPGYTGRVMDDGEHDAAVDVAMLDMLEFSLMRADRNLPYKLSARALFEQAVDAARSSYDSLDPLRKNVLMGVVLSWLMALGLLILVASVMLFRPALL